MLRKKIKKLICIMSAVIIAFSCFSITTFADGKDIPNVGNIEIGDIISMVFIAVYDENGEIIDESYIEPDLYSFDYQNDILYVDISSSEFPILCTVGSFIGFEVYFSQDYYYFGQDSMFMVYKFPASYKFVEGSFNYWSTSLGHKPNLSIPCDSAEVSSYDDIFYHNVYCLESSYFLFESTKSLNTLSFTISLKKMENSLDDLKYDNSPYGHKFFSDIGTFFKSSLNWVVDIFKSVITKPELTVLLLGFVIVGFGFTLLGKLIFS